MQYRPGAGLARWLAALCFVSFVTSAGAARAAGFELNGAGARSLGRSAAVIAGDDSPLALLHNPSLLARHTRYRALGSLNLNFPHICFNQWIIPPEPPAMLPPDPGLMEGLQGEVCDRVSVAVSPELAIEIPVTEGFTLGIGLLPPPGVSKTDFGRRDATIDLNGMMRSNPVRYAVLQSSTLQVFPTIGFGYAFSDVARIGASFGSGIAVIENVSYAYGGAGSDTRATLTATDLFVPRAAGGVSFGPFEGLEFGGWFSWTDDIHTSKRANMHVTGHVDVGGVISAPIDQKFPLVVTIPQTWSLGVGVRYASKLASAADEIGDRLSTERFDVEADFVVVGASRVTDYHIDFPEGAVIDVVNQPVNDQFIRHRWKNQYVIRLGGDLNVVPGRFALRVGASYETSGATNTYRNIDFLPYERYSLNVGFTVRTGPVDLSLAYAHLFQPDVTVRTGNLMRPLGGLAMSPSADLVINNGYYSSSYDVLAAEITATF